VRRDRTREEPADELASSFTSSLAMRASSSCVQSAQRSKGPTIPSKGDGGPYEAINGLTKATLFLRLVSGTGRAAEGPSSSNRSNKFVYFVLRKLFEGVGLGDGAKLFLRVRELDYSWIRKYQGIHLLFQDLGLVWDWAWAFDS